MHDLWLPGDFAPANQDGEAIEHRLVAMDDAARLDRARPEGPDEVTADASLVVLDFLLRHGARSMRPHRLAAALKAIANTSRGCAPRVSRRHVLDAHFASVSRTALTACRISSGPIAPMQPTRNVSSLRELARIQDEALVAHAIVELLERVPRIGRRVERHDDRRLDRRIEERAGSPARAIPATSVSQLRV